MNKQAAIKVEINVVDQGQAPYWACIQLAASATDEDIRTAFGLAADMLIEWRRKMAREGSAAGGTVPPAPKIEL